jgi:hypothetical protein
LIGIGAAVVPDGDRLATPNQLGATLPEAAPAAESKFARLARRRPVPTFHGEDAEAIADEASFIRQGARHWSIGPGFERLLEFEPHTERVKITAKAGSRLE